MDDRFVVRPGERIATDGVIEIGSSAIDASLLTGESVPVEVGPGDEVAGATINAGGRLVVRATRVGRDTALAQIGRLVTEAQSGKAPVQRLADRISAVFVPVVIGLSVGTLGVLARQRRRCHVRLLSGGRRPDHRVPVRPRPRDPDGPARRHRPGCPARHPDQGARGAGVDPPGRHDRAGQDRNGDDWRDGPGRRRPRRGRGPRRGPAPRGRAGGRLRAPDRPRHRTSRPRGAGDPAGVRGLHQSRGPRRRGRRRWARGRRGPPGAPGRPGPRRQRVARRRA